MLNAAKGKKERIGRMLEMNANDRTDVDEARAEPDRAFSGEFRVSRAIYGWGF